MSGCGVDGSGDAVCRLWVCVCVWSAHAHTVVVAWACNRQFKLLMRVRPRAQGPSIYIRKVPIYIYRDCKVPVYFSWVNISSLGQEELSFSVFLFVSRAIEHIHPPMTRASSERSGRGGFRGHSAGHCRVADTSSRMLRVVLRLFRPFAPNL
jgi:hypothetical protein